MNADVGGENERDERQHEVGGSQHYLISTDLQNHWGPFLRRTTTKSRGSGISGRVGVTAISSCGNGLISARVYADSCYLELEISNGNATGFPGAGNQRRRHYLVALPINRCNP